ncbi:hypothetical protein GCM10010329_59770 [Streptomyces spiroverticillatus]|uniref:Heparinase II/III-like C-terminal domain-containing protein n=1 Tax=Streptomyces finlayi TaxID=67296 RepID=A0A918X3R4_9ACTN|nr:heparinase II/III family protein [Streptomyces finlayi]GHA28610.1 hypothetical protein GCM10010329_59770 [Streptomyces spiroverticillatus]GHD09273.1 hypothetical protein GCM10010334_63430 [Streptomyces finlayi]
MPARRTVAASITLAALTTGLTVVAPAASAADPLVVNGGFESVAAGVPEGWGVWKPAGDGQVLVSDEAAEGSRSVELRTDSADDRVAITQKAKLPSADGGWIKVSAQVRAKDLKGGRASVRVQFKTATGTSAGSIRYVGVATGTTTWQRVEAYVEVPAGTAQLSVEPMADGAVGSYFLDDLRIDWAGDLAPVGGWTRIPLAGTPDLALDEQTRHAGKPTLRIDAKAGQQGRFRRDFPVTARQVYRSEVWAKLAGITCKQSVFEVAYTPLSGGKPVLGPDKKEIRYAYKTLDQELTDFTLLSHNVPIPDGADTLRVELTYAGPGTVWTDSSYAPELRPSDIGGKFPSSRVAHPLKNPQNMMGKADWDAIANESADVKREKLGALATADEATYLAEARKASAARTGLDQHPDFENHLRRLAELGGEQEKRRAVLGLTAFAEGYDKVPYLHAAWSKNTIPYNAVRAYDLVHDSPDWTPESRAAVEKWLRATVVNFVNLADHRIVGQHNIEVYGFRYAFGVASVLGDPDLVRHVLPMADRMFSGEQFFADGNWEEGSVSYHDQVAVFGRGAFQLLADNFTDPDGYEDTTYGLKLDHTDLVPGRYPIFTKTDRPGQELRYPDGAPITLNDTHFLPADQAVADDPIRPEYLRNIEQYHYGYFGLTAGNTKDATHAGLMFPQYSEGLPYKAGHGHGSHLGLNLWGSGMEVLPDQGYPVKPDNNRYWHMDTPAHNTPWIWSRSATPQECADALPTRASLLAYDDGARGGKQVQLVEASEPGPASDKAEVKRRLLAVIQVPGGRPYTVDLSRLKGGDAHQWFLRASEDENNTLDTALPLKDGGATVKDYYAASGHDEGLAEDRDLMKDPKIGDGAKDLSFTWTGDRTGTGVRAFVNGNEGDEVIFSKTPTLRRTANEIPKKNDFPGWHFQRRSLVTPDDTTTYGAVYDTWRKGQKPQLTSSAFETGYQGDAMTTVVRTETDRYRDTVYVSDDTTVRDVDGMKLAGRFVLVRTDKRTGAVVSSYVYGNGQVKAGAYVVVQKDAEATLPVTGTSSAYAGTPAAAATDAPNELKTGGDTPPPAWAKGLWATTRLGDGRGYGLRVDGVEPGALGVHDWVPFQVKDGAAETTFENRGERIEGPVTATVRRPDSSTLGPDTLTASVRDAVADRRITGRITERTLLDQLAGLRRDWDRPLLRNARIAALAVQIRLASGVTIDRKYADQLLAALKSATA